MGPVLNELFTCSRFRLGDFVRVVNLDMILSTSMNVDLLAEVLHAHRGALNVPTGETPTPRAIPLHNMLWLVGYPECEIPRGLTIRINFYPCTTVLFFRIEPRELGVFRKLGGIKNHPDSPFVSI